MTEFLLLMKEMGRHDELLVLVLHVGGIVVTASWRKIKDKVISSKIGRSVLVKEKILLG